MLDIELCKAGPGDEKILAYIQTESWKSAFADILPPQELEKCTDTEKYEKMYRRVLNDKSIRMMIGYVDGKAHIISAWGHSRTDPDANTAELICIHSLPDKWGCGYGSAMMCRLLDEMCQEGYSEVMLWVFEENTRARRFYEKHGFCLSPEVKIANGITEIRYSKTLGL